jgi:hypothetical protein
VAAVVGNTGTSFLLSDSEGGEGRKPRRSRIVPHACRIRSALPAADMSARGVVGIGGTLSLVGGMVEGLGGARPEDRIGSDDPVKREAAVAAAATLEKEGGMIKEDFV